MGDIRRAGVADAPAVACSPDGTRLAYTAAQPNTEIWVYDLARRTARPVTSGGGNRWAQ